MTSEHQISVEEHKRYLESNVHIYMKPMIVDILKIKPANVLDYMIEWCQTKGKDIQAHRCQLKKQRTSEEIITEIAKEHITETEQEITSHTVLPTSDDDEQSQQSEADQAKIEKQRNKAKKKNAISAEAYGQYNRLEDFTPIVIPKTPEQIQHIRSTLKMNFMFGNLDPKDQQIVIDAMAIKNFNDGDYIIKQGDDGGELFIVGEGSQKCYKLFSGNQNPTFLKNYGPGDLFGELALMYNVPRAASIIASSPSLLFSLDRQTFNAIVKTSTVKKRELYESFLNKIEILKGLESYERNKISDCLKTEVFKEGEFIIKEGDEGNRFYLIQEGTAIALKKQFNGENEKVFDYNTNDYFGELALLNNDKRRASIMVTSKEMIVASLDKMSFQRLLGSLETILKRNTAMYDKYIKKNSK